MNAERRNARDPHRLHRRSRLRRLHRAVAACCLLLGSSCGGPVDPPAPPLDLLALDAASPVDLLSPDLQDPVDLVVPDLALPVPLDASEPSADLTRCGTPGEPCCGGTCTIGCCSAMGTCVQGDQPEACGRGGACAACPQAPGPHVAPSMCVAGVCTPGACLPGYGDCNGNLLADGCEADLSSDAGNCGSCGKACFKGNVCAAGTCPVFLEPLPAATIRLGQRIAPLDLSLLAHDGVAPYAYSIVAESAPQAVHATLAGKTLSSDWALRGGKNDVTVQVADAGKAQSRQKLSITVDVPIVKGPILGAAFSPFVAGQGPGMGKPVTCDQVAERAGMVAPYVSWGLRNYTATGGQDCFGSIVHQLGLKACVGAFLSKDLVANEAELKSLIAIAQRGEADCAIVGNESLYSGFLSPMQLIAYVDRFRAAVPKVPVTTAEPLGPILDNPQVVADLDFIAWHAYPFADGVAIGAAIERLNAEYDLLRVLYPGKDVQIFETGWPSSGPARGAAVPSLANAGAYLLDVQSWSRARNVRTFYFEAFDEAWKVAGEGPIGGAWGFFDETGVLKYGGADTFAGKTVADHWTCAGVVGGAGAPSIAYTVVPPLGSSDPIQGKVQHVNPGTFYAVTYIHVGGAGWWVKPGTTTRRTIVRCDGTFTTAYATGGNDVNADQISTYLVPANYDPPVVLGDFALPQALINNAVASVTVKRP